MPPATFVATAAAAAAAITVAVAAALAATVVVAIAAVAVVFAAACCCSRCCCCYLSLRYWTLMSLIPASSANSLIGFCPATTFTCSCPASVPAFFPDTGIQRRLFLLILLLRLLGW